MPGSRIRLAYLIAALAALCLGVYMLAPWRAFEPVARPIPPSGSPEQIGQSRADASLAATAEIAGGLVRLRLRNLGLNAVTDPDIICDFYSNSGEHLRSGKARLAQRIIGRSETEALLDFGPVPERATRLICYRLATDRP